MGLRTVKILLPLKDVPAESTVRKLTGSLCHTVIDRIRIFDVSSETGGQYIDAPKGFRFLTGEVGDFNTYLDCTEVVWEVSLCDLKALLGEEKE